MAHQTCKYCGGNAGGMIDGAHCLCQVRHDMGNPTPCLGMRCETCGGAGTLGKGGAMLFFSLGPAAISRSIKAQFPPCPDCAGKGYK